MSASPKGPWRTHLVVLHHRTMRTWPSTIAAARAMQQRLRGLVIARDRLGKLRHVAGVDVGFEDDGNTARAAHRLASGKR